MKLTILGAGSAYGSPMVFNDWGNIKDKNNPKNRRSRACSLLQLDNADILFDIGPDYKSQINDNNIANIDAVFLTHGHYDHIASISELWRSASILNKQIHVFASVETMGEVKMCFPYLFKTNHETGSDKIVWHEFENGAEIEFKGYKWQTSPLKHGKLTSTAYRLGDFAYLMDLEMLSEDNVAFLQALSFMLVECNNGVDDVENGHSSWQKVQQYIELTKPKNVLLTHLSARVDYEEFKAILPNNVDLAFDGMELNLSLQY